MTHCRATFHADGSPPGEGGPTSLLLQAVTELEEGFHLTITSLFTLQNFTSLPIRFAAFATF